MLSHNAPQTPLDQRFTDMDECGRRLGWSFDFRQLDAGPLDARARLIATAAGSAALHLELNRSFHQLGRPPDGMLTFGIPDPGGGELGWCGAAATDADLVNFNLPSGFDGTNRAGFSGCTLSFTESLFREVQQIMGIDIDIRSLLSACLVWTHSPGVAARLRQELTAAFRTPASAGGSASPEAGAFLDFEAPALILQFITSKQGRERVPDISLRRRAVRTALDYLAANNRLPLTASELCRQAGVSAPSLYRGFMERFGIGPKRYLHIRRLEGVRRELRSAPPEVKIVDVANGWGFWHMGRFAADYRRHFGELHSHTLHSVNGT